VTAILELYCTCPESKVYFPNEKYIKFLQERIDSLKIQDDVARKHLKRPSACILQETDKVLDTQAMFSKFKRNSVLVQDLSSCSASSIFLGKINVKDIRTHETW